MTTRDIINNERLNRTGTLNLSNQSLTEVPQEVFSLPHLPRLTHLDISGNDIKGHALVKLVSMKNLIHLDIRQNPAAPADIKGLTRALPNCRIVF